MGNLHTWPDSSYKQIRSEPDNINTDAAHTITIQGFIVIRYRCRGLDWTGLKSQQRFASPQTDTDTESAKNISYSSAALSLDVVINSPWRFSGLEIHLKINVTMINLTWMNIISQIIFTWWFHHAGPELRYYVQHITFWTGQFVDVNTRGRTHVTVVADKKVKVLQSERRKRDWKEAKNNIWQVTLEVLQLSQLSSELRHLLLSTLEREGRDAFTWLTEQLWEKPGLVSLTTSPGDS